MALRDIVLDGNGSCLRKKSREVTVFDDKLAKLLDDMRETMHKYDGVGLAAPQIGILRRIAVIEVDDLYVELINPKIVKASGSQIGSEGCLSVPNKSCNVERPNQVEVRYKDRTGKNKVLKGKELLARACCHEIDHLDGILYYDKKLNEEKK